MGSKKNTITINGKVYDTITGDIVASSLPFKHIITPTKPARHIAVRTIETKTKAAPLTTADSTKIAVKTSHSKKDVHRHKPRVATALHQKTERPKTLMRSTVKQPSVHEAKKTTVNVTGLAPQPTHKIIHSSVPQRTTRASTVTKSTRVSRFAQNSTSVTQKVETIPVKVAPKLRETTHDAPPVRSHAPPIHATPRNGSHDIFEKAMQNATSHQQTSIGKHHSKKRKQSQKLTIVTISATVLILGCFFAYSNAPRIALQNAETSTGIAARIPSYKPTGFTLNRNVAYQPGKVVLSFSSNTDNSAFSITQEKTSLSNESLTTSSIPSSSNKVALKTTTGTTIYIYDDNNATWINNGIWYNVQGTAQLSRSQLLNIASSM